MHAGGEQQPLPIAVVSGQQNDRLARVDATLHDLGILHRDAAPDRLRARAESPERFDQRVGQVPVRAPNDRRALVVALVRERVGDVALAIVAAPAHHVIGDEVDQRTPRIEQAERHAGQQAQHEFHEALGGDYEERYFARNRRQNSCMPRDMRP